MYSCYVYVCVSVCLSLTALPRYCTELGGMVGVPLVVHYWAHLQSVHGFRCYDNIHVCKLIALYTKKRRTRNVSE